jgi:hypothetical protein
MNAAPSILAALASRVAKRDYQKYLVDLRKKLALIV